MKIRRLFLRLFVLAAGLLPALSGPALPAAEWNVPRAGQVLSFPRDHGSHPDFKIEWWYLTGHLFAGERRFGFQATFFRLGKKPVDVPAGIEFGTEQLYLAHMGLSEPATGAFLHEERLNRGGWDAGSKIGQLEMNNGNWSLQGTGAEMTLEGTIFTEAALSLKFSPQKSQVIFGDDGISRKGPEGTAASYYITFPRVLAEGTIMLDGEEIVVSGEAWMDHEISSSQLDRNQIGWNWACLQFFDGREIMGYVLRTDQGKPSEYSQLTWIGEDGSLTHVSYGDYEWRHGGSWKSPMTGATYPISPLILTRDPVSGVEKQFRLVPLMEAQEMVGAVGGVSYWEGACDVRDEQTGEIVGRAFLEMTGYTDSIGDKLR